MSNRHINFLAERRKGLTKTEVQDRKIMRLASFIFGGAFLLFLLIFGVRFYFDRQLVQVKEAQKGARSQILNNELTERSFVIFVYKLSALAELTQDKQDKNNAISYFSHIFGPEVFIRQISFLEKERILTLKIQSDSIFSLKQVFSLLNSEPVRAQFSSINPSDLTRTAQGDYQMAITAVVKSNTAVSPAPAAVNPGAI